MYFLFICVGVVIAALFAWQLGEFVRRLRFSREYVRKARAFQREGNAGTSLLVLGDSTAVGVGADTPQESVAGLMAQALSIDSVENRGVSGAQVRDLISQIGRARRHGYTYILIMVGGNDIIRFHSASSTTLCLSVTSGSPR
jgi:lysophospholipase L1-like esterase